MLDEKDKLLVSERSDVMLGVSDRSSVSDGDLEEVLVLLGDNEVEKLGLGEEDTVLVVVNIGDHVRLLVLETVAVGSDEADCEGETVPDVVGSSRLWL